MTPRRLRVIAWGAGAVGSEIVTTILDHRPDTEIVGARVYSPARTARTSALSSVATTDTTKILALQADCVRYARRHTSIDEVCAILSSGKNVVATAFLFHSRRIDAAYRDRVAAACDAGGSSVHGSGLNPGSLSGVLPLALPVRCSRSG